jgi:hypothetical protein
MSAVRRQKSVMKFLPYSLWREGSVREKVDTFTQKKTDPLTFLPEADPPLAEILSPEGEEIKPAPSPHRGEGWGEGANLY